MFNCSTTSSRAGEFEDRGVKLRPALALVAALLLVVLPACGNKKDAKKGAAGKTTTTVARAAASPGADASPGATGAPGGKSGTGSGAAPAPAPTQGAPLQANDIRPADPGRYLYNESGNQEINCPPTPPQSGPPPSPTTLTVDPANGNRQQAVRDRRGPNGQGLRITTVFEFRSDGYYLAFLRQEQFTPIGSDTWEFEPNPPVLALPRSPKAGQSWQFSLTSKDGRLKVDVNNTIEAPEENVQLGDGSASPATRIKSTRHATGQSNLGTIDVTENNTTWGSIRDRMIVKEVSDSNGRIGVSCTTTSHVEAVLQSTRPS